MLLLPRWVIRVGLTISELSPVYPYEQALLVSVGMSRRCQNRTHAPQQLAASLDDLVGSCEQTGRHGEAKRLTV
jgi:hypothetical protein